MAIPVRYVFNVFDDESNEEGLEADNVVSTTPMVTTNTENICVVLYLWNVDHRRQERLR